MNIIEIIEKKKKGKKLSDDEINYAVNGYVMQRKHERRGRGGGKGGGSSRVNYEPEGRI